MRAEHFIRFVPCVIIGISSIAIPLCSADCSRTSKQTPILALTHSPTSIQNLARELQGKKEDEVEAAIVNRFGPATRYVGSGIISPQWDVESGVLNYRLGLVSFRANAGKTVWLTATVNKALRALTADSFEMTTLPEPQMKYWLGDLQLKSDSTYEFVDSGQNLDHRTGQTQNFFVKHSKGRFEIQFAPGCTAQTVLERLTDGTFLCTLTFQPENNGPEVSYEIMVCPSERRLAFSAKRRRPMFLMDKGFEK